MTIVYDCDDLLRAERDSLNFAEGDKSAERSAVDNLIEVITATTGSPLNNRIFRRDERLFPILPNPRDGDGWRHLETGPGTLKIFAGNLAVCQTLAVHEEIEDVLAQLRAALAERKE